MHWTADVSWICLGSPLCVATLIVMVSQTFSCSLSLTWIYGIPLWVTGFQFLSVLGPWSSVCAQNFVDGF